MSTEADLIKTALPWFKWKGYTVHQEVQFGPYVIDLVLTKGDEVIAVEAKLSLALDVMTQAKRWVRQAHRSAVLVPYESITQRRKLAMDTCIDFLGIDVMEVVPNMTDNLQGVVTVFESNMVIPADVQPLRAALHPNQEQTEAGKPAPERDTPFKRTCKKLIEVVREIGPCRINLAIKEIDHHYKNDEVARRSLTKWGLQRGGRGVEGLIFDQSNQVTMVMLDPEVDNG